MIVKLLTEHHLEFLSLKQGCRGSSVSTYVEMPHCWKSHVMAQNFMFMYRQSCKVLAVIPPEGAVVNGDASDENGEEGEKKKRYFYNSVNP